MQHNSTDDIIISELQFCVSFALGSYVFSFQNCVYGVKHFKGNLNEKVLGCSIFIQMLG